MILRFSVMPPLALTVGDYPGGLSGGGKLARQIGKYWKSSEFECSCGCGKDEIHPAIIDLADKVRGHLGVPMQCNSGVRCADRNKAVGGRPNSMHLPKGILRQGHAADLTFSAPALRDRINLLRLYVLLESHGRKHGNLGLGLYDSFIHVDVRGQLGLNSGRWNEFEWPRL